MSHSATPYSVLICLIAAMATSALAQQPPDPVRSDSMANTAMGSNALLSVKLSESACHNTASGEDALYSDTSGSYNTATGFSSLFSNKTGNNNTAAGYESLFYNTSGSSNTASGSQALYTNTTGSYNTALGEGALRSARTGSNNIAVGYEAGYNLTNGVNNIEIGNKGLAADYNVIKIGVEGLQAKTFIAGIYKTSVSGSAVMVNSSGQLGVVVSSERFKTDIAPMVLSKCALSGCHVSGGHHPYMGTSTAYQEIVNGGYVNTLIPKQSIIYIKINGEMKEYIPSAVDRQKIYDWIRNGAPNN